MTRVYGISFPKQKLLTEYLELVEKAKERDHRKIGKELELFTFSNRVGHGLPLWLPNGTELRDRLQDFLEDAQRRAGYKKVMSSHIGSKELYKLLDIMKNMVKIVFSQYLLLMILKHLF